MKPLYLLILILVFPLMLSAQEPVTAEGEVIFLTGRILDVDGSPVAGAVIEIWQTDYQGVYDHPGDRKTEIRDRGFQFFGSSTTDSQGRYSFRTILPGEYAPRPPHIHVKIKFEDRVLLVTQFYFQGYGNTPGGRAADLVLELTGDEQRTASIDVVIRTGLKDGDRALTPSQSEGPYYPLQDPGSYDNDLANVE
jgi:protocatechuate 3,4-dioxygenase beta subunit